MDNAAEVESGSTWGVWEWLLRMCQDDDWFCEDCNLKKSLYPYCICYTDTGNAMIACDNPECDKEWFHLSCMGITEIPGLNYCI